MNPLDATWLTAGARQLRRDRALAALAMTAGVGLLVGAVATRAGSSPGIVGAAVGAAALGTLAACRVHSRRRPLTPGLLAGYVDRVVPQAEESTALLLADGATLPILPKLQRRRTTLALSNLPELPELPRGPRRPFLRAAWALGVTAAVVYLLPGSNPVGAVLESGRPARRTPIGAASTRPPELTAVRLTIRPPAYTGRPLRRVSTWDVDVEEGAELTWELRVPGTTTRGRLVTTGGDTVILTRSGLAGYVARLTARRSTLYRVLLDQAEGPPVASSDHRLGVRLDAAPVVTIVSPDQRTTVGPGGSLRLPVEVLATDDYGVDSATMVATVTKGQGEGVKFRERRFPFESRVAAAGHGALLRRTIDLKALGLEPGDELYFHVVATDRHPPVPNETRSETVFIAVLDTARETLIPGAAIALNLPPDFFRSQRQLIIDTEKLQKERGSMPRSVFRDRSNGLGIDQGLLRLRYGQFMGDEFDGSPLAGREAHAPGAEPELPKQPREPEPDPTAEFRHEHDTPENTTLLAPQLKAKLHDAITQMWSSELYLRTTDPGASLPFQYRALVLLQEIRQDARSYVKRVGFDPPPLEPDRKRLTGDLAKVGRPTRESRTEDNQAEPALQEGIGVLQRLRLGGVSRDEDRAILEAAGTELARLAANDPTHLLEPLRALRAVITTLGPKGSACAGCLSAAEAGFWLALPAATPRPGSTRQHPGALLREYRRRLSVRP